MRAYAAVSFCAPVLSLALAACASHGPPLDHGAACDAPARPMVRLELLFGTSRPDGRTVSQAEWLDFLEREVTPRFPAGLTVLSGLGQWQGEDGRTVREQSKVLTVWHEPSERSDGDIEAIRAAYRQRFDQESVLRVESVSCVSF